MKGNEMIEQTKEGLEPVAWLSIDCIGERYLCFDKPVDNDEKHALVSRAKVFAIISQKEAEIERLEKELQDQCISCKWPSDCKTLHAEVERLNRADRYSICDECGTPYSFDPTDGGTICVKCQKDKIESLAGSLAEWQADFRVQTKRIAELEHERNEEAAGWAACQAQLVDSCRSRSMAENRIAELEASTAMTAMRDAIKSAALEENQKQAAALAKAREALAVIAQWISHTPEYAVDYGSNGVRDLYRAKAREALAAIDALIKP